MKQVLLLLALLLAVTTAKADVGTTDEILLSELTVEPGSSNEYSLTVSLHGNSQTTYTAFEIDFILPEGLDVVYEESSPKVEMILSLDGIYPYTLTEMEIPGYGIVEVPQYSHSLSCNMVTSRNLKVIVVSTQNGEFTKTSGDLFKFYVKASPYLKPGDAGIEVSAKLIKLIKEEGQIQGQEKHIPATYTSTSVEAGTTSTLNLKVSASNKFGTCILPFDYDLPADGSLRAYTCDKHTEEELLLSKADSKLEAYTPYILYSETGFDANISGDVDASQYPEDGTVKHGCLVGTIVQKELTEQTSYVMQNQGSGAMFHKVGSAPFVLPPGKCYAELPEGAEARRMILNDATGIEDNLSLGTTEQDIYNLTGQRIRKMQSQSIYIVNGQKVVKE